VNFGNETNYTVQDRQYKLAQQVMSELNDAVKKYLADMASKGGKAKAQKYDKETLRKWAKLVDDHDGHKRKTK
jgi:hypothetical protein